MLCTPQPQGSWLTLPNLGRGRDPASRLGVLPLHGCLLAWPVHLGAEPTSRGAGRAPVGHVCCPVLKSQEQPSLSLLTAGN